MAYVFKSTFITQLLFFETKPTTEIKTEINSKIQDCLVSKVPLGASKGPLKNNLYEPVKHFVGILNPFTLGRIDSI